MWLALASLSMCTAVALGAFGAHGLVDKISAEKLEVFHTAVRYQVIHSLAVLVLAQPFCQVGSALIWMLFVGTFIFSGSLYLYIATGIKAFAMATPFGGMILLIFWFFLFIRLIKRYRKF